MAKTVRDANLETRAARGRLKPAGKPYFRAIDEGLHLGYRKGKTAGKWVMRSYAGDGVYRVEMLASADDTVDADGAAFLSFAQAQAMARTRFVESRRVAAGLPVKGGAYTVKLCMDEYLAWLDQNRKSGRSTAAASPPSAASAPRAAMARSTSRACRSTPSNASKC